MVQSSIFRSKVLFANFDQKFFAPRKFGFSPKSSICALSHFWKCESSEIELLAKKIFFAQKFYLRTLAKKFSLRESSVLCPKVLFANFGQHTFALFKSAKVRKKNFWSKNCPTVQSAQSLPRQNLTVPKTAEKSKRKGTGPQFMTRDASHVTTTGLKLWGKAGFINSNKTFFMYAQSEIEPSLFRKVQTLTTGRIALSHIHTKYHPANTSLNTSRS